MNSVIGLGGRLRSGKDAFADHLVERHSYVKMGMSDVLLDHMLAVNPWIKVRLREAFRLAVRPGFHRASVLVDRLGYVDAKTIADFRRYMQADGTEAGRNIFGENVWVNLAKKRVLKLREAGERVVLTGVRYPNELDMVRQLHGSTLWVSRPSADATAKLATHTSEKSLGAQDFDRVIDNSGTLADLHAAADEEAYRSWYSADSPVEREVSVPVNR